MNVRVFRERMKKMKIIDFKMYGNVIKLYLGDDQTNDYWGDDWNDRPYEHNAEEVYDRYVVDTIDLPIKSKYCVTTPEYDYTYRGNSPYSKEDFKNGVPFMVIGEMNSYDFLYSNEVDNTDNVILRYEDDIVTVMKKLDKYLIKL